MRNDSQTWTRAWTGAKRLPCLLELLCIAQAGIVRGGDRCDRNEGVRRLRTHNGLAGSGRSEGRSQQRAPDRTAAELKDKCVAVPNECDRSMVVRDSRSALPTKRRIAASIHCARAIGAHLSIGCSTEPL